MGPEPAPVRSPVGRLATTVYGAQAGGRTPLLDGPWWLGVTAAITLGVLVVGTSPWKWLALPFVAILLWLPFVVRSLVALQRAVSAFREGLRS